MTEYNVFCFAKNYNDDDSFQQERYRAFNKVVGEKRYKEILKEIREIFGSDFKLELNENTWEDEWRKVAKEKWIKISKIPEFDKKVVEGVIGFKLDLDEQETVTVKISKSTLDMLKKEGIKIVK